MAGESFLAGFHAVGARLRSAPESIRCVYIDFSRKDKRMAAMRDSLEKAGVKLVAADARRLSAMVGREIPHQGLVASVLPTASVSLDMKTLLEKIDDKTLILVLDGVTDPRNFGACLRSADAAGATCVIVPKDRSAGMTPVTAKAAAGANESVPVVRVVNLARAITELKDAGVFVIGAAGETDQTIYSFDQKRAVAWVLGAEGEGLRELTRKKCDALAAIPLLGSVESLNVSVAAAVCLYETVRQRR